MTKSRITLLHVEDDPLWQTTVAGVLRDWPEMEQCDCVGTASAAKACAPKLQPQIVLLDVVLPDGDGLQLARELAMQPWQPKLLMLTVRRDDVVLQAAGAKHIDGLIWKSADVGAHLAEALRRVIAGTKYFPAEVREALRKFRADPSAYFKILSDREMELLPLLGSGASDGDIAAALGLSVHTVKSHRHSILAKLNLPSTPRLIHWAIQRGFVRFPSDGWVVREDRGDTSSDSFHPKF